MLIGAARQEWEKQMPTNRSMIEQTQQTNDCRVDAIGLRGLTGGGNGATAQVLASLVISMNQGAANAGSPSSESNTKSSTRTASGRSVASTPGDQERRIPHFYA